MKKTTTARKPVGGKKRPIMKVSKNPVRPTKYEHQFDVERKLDATGIGEFSFKTDYKGKAHGNLDIYRETYPYRDGVETGEVYHSKYTSHDVKKWTSDKKKTPLGEFIDGLWGGK